MITKEVFEKHKEDLQKSGLSDLTIKKAGLYSKSARGFLETKGCRTILVIPYLHNPKALNFKRMKLFPPLVDYAGGQMKYYQPKGTPNHLYVTETAYRNRNSLEDLYLTEGEKKALALHQNGLSSIGISGLWNWKNKISTELIEDFNLFAFEKRKIYLIPDNDFEDTKHRGSLITAVNQLATKMAVRGAKVFLLRLPYGKCKGVDDYLVGHTIEELLKLKDSAEYLIPGHGAIEDNPSPYLCGMSEAQLKEYFERAAPPEYLTLEEKPLFFSPILATRVGLAEAIILHKIHGWLKYNFEKKAFLMVKNGRTWVFRGYAYLQRELPFLSKKKIIRSIKELEDRGILISANYNKRPGDRTKWYSIDYPVLMGHKD